MSRPIKIILWSGVGLIAILAAGAAALLTFDWNRAKPWINAHVSEAAGRPFAIHGNLSLTWHAPQSVQAGWFGWIPWPRLNAQHVTVGNPDWMKARQVNMAEISQVTFSINPLPLISGKIVIPSLALDTPRLMLQRDKDGANNWTLRKKPGSTWPLELHQLAVSKGSLHLLDAVARADIHMEIDTLEPGRHDDYRIGWKLGGMFKGEKVSGSGRIGALLALQKQDMPYPLEASVRVGSNELHAQGVLARPCNPAAFDLRLRISGVSMGQIYSVIGVALPETPPFTTEGRLTGTLGGDWTYENFTGKIGATDLAGTLHYRARRPRPLVEGTVTSNFLNFRDLSPLMGVDSSRSKAQRGDKFVQPADKIFPAAPFRTERWISVDADVQFNARKIMRNRQLPIENLATRFHLNDGMLSLAPLKFDLAGGTLAANIRLNGRSKPVKGELKLSARRVKLKQLFPGAQAMQASLGEINGDMSLTGSGNSIAALLASSNGEAKTLIDQGAISKLLLEQMGLNISSIVATELFGDRQVKLHCAAGEFAVTKGVMQTKTFVVDTEEAVIYMNGKIDLAQERLALSLNSQSRGWRLISLRSPVYVTGPFMKPRVEMDKGSIALKAGSALALGALAPIAAALLPLVNMDSGGKSECAALLVQAKAGGK